jgi:ABC-type glycerol-3-phosphate transport system permease component
VLGRILLLLVTAAGAAVFIIPFIWMVSTSVKPTDQVYRLPPVWIPREFQWDWYRVGWQDFRFALFFRNTFTIVLLNQIGMLVSCSAAAFGFARLRFRGRNLLFLIVLSTMMLPGHIRLIPMYVLYARMGWVNTWLPLIVPNYFAISAFTIFLLRQYFMTIPLEMDDAARIDGAGTLRLFWQIILPMSRSALGVACIFQFTYDWGNFFQALIYLNSRQKFTVAIGLNMMNNRMFTTDLQPIMAMTVVSIIPVLGLFFLAQRYFIQGIVITGVKG